MHYDPTRRSLYSPESGAPLDPALFAGNGDALAAELARLAYWRFEADPAPLTAALAALGLREIALFHDASVNSQGFAALDGAGTAWCAFRGTQPDSLKDLANDARAWPSDWPGGGKAHAGFARAWLGTEPEHGMAAQVAKWLARHDPARLVVTGHSLGAALATLCAAEHGQAELVSFGSPRVGNAAFAARFAHRMARRHVDCCDVIARIPPEPLYAHVGALHYYDRHGRPLSAPGDAVVAADRRAGAIDYFVRHAWRPGNVLLRGLADHAPINYVSALLGIREG